MTVFSSLHPFTRGYDDVFKHFETLLEHQQPNYPPYNIVKTGDYSHVIEVALAGYSKAEVEVILAENTLTIKSSDLPTKDKPKKIKDEDVQYSTDRNQWDLKMSPDGSTSFGQHTEDWRTSTLIHKGIAKRAFKRTFTLAEDVIVSGAVLKDGLLKVELERVVPEEKKPKVIKIK